jgi:alkylated DNA repair dioxygenase AlkB
LITPFPMPACASGDPLFGPGSPRSIQQSGLTLRHWPQWLQQQTHPALQPEQLLAHLRQEIPWQQPRIRVYGRIHPIPRQSFWIADTGCQYRYSGLLQTPEPWSWTHPWPVASTACC